MEITEETKTALVIVPDNQLSLAIGKEGQNARLAAKLTGWRIDIKSESQIKELEARKIFADLPAEEVPAAQVAPAAQGGLAAESPAAPALASPADGVAAPHGEPVVAGDAAAEGAPRIEEKTIAE